MISDFQTLTTRAVAMKALVPYVSARAVGDDMSPMADLQVEGQVSLVT
jgi:hypothetical protein